MTRTRGEMGDEMWEVFVGMHRMLLRLAGRVPDEWLTHARELLGGGDLFQLPDTVVGSMATLGMPLTTAEAELLRTVMNRYVDEREPQGIDKLLVSEVTPATDYRFSRFLPRCWRWRAGVSRPHSI